MKTKKTILENGDLQITLTFDKHDQDCLNDDLLDIEEWYRSGPSQEKINRCKRLMIKENREKLMQSDGFLSKTVGEVNAIFADEKQVVSAIKALQDYKNRAQREQEERV